jgi:hypothetical protein
MAMTPNPITRITATGVRSVSRLVWRAVAPVWKGDAWPKASAGRSNSRKMLAVRDFWLRSRKRA